MVIRTIERARRELDELLPHDWFRGNPEYLQRVLAHMELVFPKRAAHLSVFMLHYGLGDRPPMKQVEIARELDRSHALIGQKCRKVVRWLRHPKWKEESSWPKLQIETELSTMNPVRVSEIAIRVLVWRCKSLGAEHFIAVLKDAGVALEIDDAEMLEFFKAITDRLDKPTV